jgi:UDP-N-acetylglucosamine--N-acetylmuramyl-(pentapeptide) pyrophosphoryl-undecaprenol N-acetylglucosamine transferase
VRRDPKRRVVFVGTQHGLEKNIVPKAGFPLEFISVGGLQGKRGLELIKNFFLLPVGIIQAFVVVTKYRPHIVLGVGGYSSGPVLLAARIIGYPTAIHEQNAFPGLTNRLLARFVTAVAVAFKEAAGRLKRLDASVTGNPVRREFFEVKRKQRTDNRKRILIFGGSQGSHILNEAMTGALMFLYQMKDEIEIVHQTGTKDLDQVRLLYQASAFAKSRIVAYLDPIVDEIANADLVVSRGGAMTIGELAAAGRAAILVPFAAATNNHQELNARVVERAGGAIVITEAQLTPERLATAITQVLSDAQKTVQMGAAAKSLAAPDATKKIVELLEKIERTE